jgi:hypothetical protein
MTRSQRSTPVLVLMTLCACAAGDDAAGTEAGSEAVPSTGTPVDDGPGPGPDDAPGDSADAPASSGGDGTDTGSGDDMPPTSESESDAGTSRGSESEGGTNDGSDGGPMGITCLSGLHGEFDDGEPGPLWSHVEVLDGTSTALEDTDGLTLTVTGSSFHTARYEAQHTYTLVDCEIVVPVDFSSVWGTGIVLDGSVGGATNVLLFTTSGSYLSWIVADPSATTSDSVDYDPVAHRVLRVREDGGTVIFEASPDGRAWAAIGQVAAPPWIAEVRPYLSIDGYPGDSVTFGSVNGA